MIPRNGDKWWALLLIVVCIAFAANFFNDVGQRRESARQRNEVVANQLMIMTNQATIMKALSATANLGSTVNIAP